MQVFEHEHTQLKVAHCTSTGLHIFSCAPPFQLAFLPGSPICSMLHEKKDRGAWRRSYISMSLAMDLKTRQTLQSAPSIKISCHSILSA